MNESVQKKPPPPAPNIPKLTTKRKVIPKKVRPSGTTLKGQIKKYMDKNAKEYGPWPLPPPAPILKKRKGDMVKRYSNGGGVRPADNEYS
jgi:hypothetical protein